MLNVAEKLNFGFFNKLDLVIQTDSASSGIACLSMILQFYKKDGNYNKLKRDCDVNSQGMCVDQVNRVANTLGFNSRVVNVSSSDFHKVSTPCILHRSGSQFVVLKDINKRHATIYDPQGEIKKISTEDFLDEFESAVIELTPNVSFDDANPVRENRKFSWSKMLGTTTGLRSSLFTVLVLAFMLEISALMLPIITQITYDHVIVTHDLNLLTTLGIAMILLQIIRVIINTLRAWAVMVMSASLNIQWFANVFSHMVHLPPAWFSKHHLGDIVSRFESIHPIQGMATTRSIEVGLDGVMSIGVLAMMFFYNPLLALIVVASVILYFLLRMLWYRAEKKSTEENVIYSAQQHSVLLETLRSVKTISLFNGLEQRKSLWLNRLVAERNANLKTQRIRILTESSYWILFGIETVAVLWLGALFVMDNTWSIGMMVAFIVYKDQFIARSIGVVDKVLEFKIIGVQVERLSGIVLTEREKIYPALVQVSELEPKLEVNNVSFSYNQNNKAILQDCSITANPGESIAIIGPSGCGKTTLLNLMLGLAEPNAGEVKFGGVQLNQIGTMEYRDTIGAVMQDDALLSGTVAENIAFFDSDADTDKIIECAKIASVHEEIVKMPLGYQTLVGDMGSTLSGGQKQRILLARALYKNPKILFLDEATSQLDVLNEEFINTSVRSLGITTVVIAHRPDTIKMADKIYLIEDGKAKLVEIDILEQLKNKAITTEGVAL
ncbi:peptidase domain-containing ABC transporter [Pseudoalteromonas umbrosa]|uniref:peptidase domain-containing ABC transporter n=1 Tax=Pseudoalteromonas umbrosa TaxID=3048489 RepID=UPI0024C2D6F7|nr:peptidase domain-containing ABC transporter [Pseudoalteromonas sp. B95]MDK1288230.1 peptidase domain-containing ABC transporter [Pseudoalteromonas sp. B95]